MYICEICNKTFLTKRLKINHVSLHNRVLWHECNWNKMKSNKPSRNEIITHYETIKHECKDILFHHILKNKLFLRKLKMNEYLKSYILCKRIWYKNGYFDNNNKPNNEFIF